MLLFIQEIEAENRRFKNHDFPTDNRFGVQRCSDFCGPRNRPSPVRRVGASRASLRHGGGLRNARAAVHSRGVRALAPVRSFLRARQGVVAAPRAGPAFAEGPARLEAPGRRQLGRGGAGGAWSGDLT